jgi:hypothetical protein
VRSGPQKPTYTRPTCSYKCELGMMTAKEHPSAEMRVWDSINGAQSRAYS